MGIDENEIKSCGSKHIFTLQDRLKIKSLQFFSIHVAYGVCLDMSLVTYT